MSRTRGPIARIPAVAITILVATSCISSKRETTPDPAKLHFPTGIAADPAGDYVYVVSTNFDVGYTGGVVVPIEVKAGALVPASAIQVGSFGGDLAIVGGGDGAGAAGFLAVRDSDTVQFFAIERKDGVPVLSCGKKPEKGLAACDPDHEVVPPDKPDPYTGEILSMGRDLFAVASGTLPSTGDSVLYAGSLLDGNLSVLTLDKAMKPTLVAEVDLPLGTHTIVEGRAVEGKRVVYATSRLNNVISVLTVSRDEPGGQVRMNRLPSSLLPQITSSGDYFRGMAVSGDGQLLYASYRSPPSLAVFRVEDGGTLALRGLVALHGGPAQVAVVPGQGPYGELVYVTDFDGDGVYCVDPTTMTVLDRIDVGMGPYGMAVVKNVSLGVHRAYVTLFEENAVSVIDLDSASVTWNTEVARIRP